MPECAKKGPGAPTDTTCHPVTCEGDGTAMYEIIYTPNTPGNADGKLEFGNDRCMKDGPTLYTAAQIQFFRQTPDLPAPGLSPPTGITLVGVFPTLFWTPGDPQTTTHTLVGTQVRLKITPVSYRWSFGNGQTLNTDYPGIPHDTTNHPLQKLRGETDPRKYRPYVIHRYTDAGETCHTTVTITYTGHYSVNGDTWTPIDGTITHTSPPRALTTVQYRSQYEAKPQTPHTPKPPPPSPPTNPQAPTDHCTPTQS
ncbi:MAG: hypothetical protein ACRDPW_02715 [Mycobacteriales bacterium]